MTRAEPKLAERFSENLTQLRKAGGWSQEEIAFRAGVHRTQISLMEGGQRLPRFETVVRLVGALGCRADDLLEGISYKPMVAQPGGFAVVGREQERD